VPGEFIADTYELSVPRDTPAGTYFIEVGLYDARTGVRVQRSDNIPPSGQNTSASAITAARLSVTVLVR
jgi:hypothetical protein